jgi:isoquinoline 1-oxidoreductase beta subunit
MMFAKRISPGNCPERSPALSDVSRRDFLKVSAVAGGGLLLSVNMAFLMRDAEAAVAGGFTPNAFISIGADGRVLLTMPYVEMGQGTYTAIPMLIAEELEVDLQQVKLEHAPPNEKLYANPLLGIQATGNSNAIRGAWQPLREAGAIARTMLFRPRRSAGTSTDGLPRAKRGSDSHADRSEDQIRRAGQRRCPHAGPEKGRAQAAREFQAYRHRREAFGYAGEGER